MQEKERERERERERVRGVVDDGVLFGIHAYINAILSNWKVKKKETVYIYIYIYLQIIDGYKLINSQADIKV